MQKRNKGKGDEDCKPHWAFLGKLSRGEKYELRKRGVKDKMRAK